MFTKTQKHKNTKMQRSERRTPSWLGGMPSDAAFRWWDIKTQRNVAISLFHSTLCFWKRRNPCFFRKKTCNPLRNEQQNGIEICGNLSYLRNQRAIGPFITHCHQQKIFTPLQAHGMENISAWRGRKFSLATQKNTAILDKQARSNKILQNKQK